MEKPDISVVTHYSVWWPRQNFSEEMVRSSLLDLRSRLTDAGLALANNDIGAGVNEPDPARAQTPEYIDSEDEDNPQQDLGALRNFTYARGPEAGGPEEPAAELGWMLVDLLRWTLRSDGIISEDAVKHAVDGMGATAAGLLCVWLNDRAAELATQPLLAGKSRALRLQFAALGQVWFNTLQGSPTLVDYLEGETQPIDLEKLLQ